MSLHLSKCHIVENHMSQLICLLCIIFSFLGRDPDDLVAMGTLWSPNNPNSSQGQPQQQPMSRSSIPNNISSNAFPTKSNPSSSSVNPSMSASTTMTPQRKYTSNNVRPIVVQNNTISGIRNNLKEKDKEKDGRYHKTNCEVIAICFLYGIYRIWSQWRIQRGFA